MIPRRQESEESVLRTFVREVADRIAGPDSPEADDLAQTTILAALVASGANVRESRSWLRTIAMNARRKQLAKDLLRSDAERRYAEDSVYLMQARRRSDARIREEAERLMQALEQLGTANREVLTLRFLDGQPPREIARVLAVPVNTIRSRIRRALSALRGELQRR